MGDETMSKADRYFGNTQRYHAWADWYIVAQERDELDPCEYGHFHCSSTGDSGACSDEIQCAYETAYSVPLITGRKQG